ncbi:uncharacterized protein LOC108983424 isoform X2 [Juglans regia]|uniref:Uncharacterized protein LOC108983424 isoform X2 n=1 Tax=Juglans regia TaxID=51240 RepID=A0A6P9EAL2_JUGRE|nr:uncharacterized protein LOC108983424 isoform X2 [Juglans regia]
MDQPNEDQEEPPIAELLGVKKKKNKNTTVVSSPRTRTTTGVKAKKKKEGGPAAVDSAAQYPTGSTEDCCNAPKVTVLKFDNSVENHFRAIDTISQLCGEPEDGALEEQEIQQLSSSITFLRFASAVGSIDGKDVVSGIELPQLSSAAVPKNEEPSGGAATHAESSGSGCSKDFVIHVGGHVWALDWCPRVHERPECPIKCEFIAVAAHPPGSSYHKIGAPLTGRGVVQIWGLLNVSMNEDEVPPPAEKPKQGPKNGRDMKDKLTVSKRPRGRPRKKPVEDNVAITTQKRPRGRPRKNLIEKPPDNLDCSEQYVQALAVQFPEDSSDFLAIDGVLGDTQEHAIQEDSGKKQKSYKQAASKCNPALETPLKCRRLKNKKRTRSCSDNTSPLLLELIEDMGSSVVNQMQAEPAASVNFSHNGSLEISSAGCLIPNDVALPRVVFCLAHNGKVAWDTKWRPSNECYSIKMGYLAVLLGNGSLEVWEVPLPRTVKVIYSSDHPEGTDPRFVKLEPVFRCSMLKGGGTQSIPLTVEWSASTPHDLILAGCHDGTVALWKFSVSSSSKDTRPLLCFSADTVPIRALAWAPVESDLESANVILTAGHGGLKFWDLRFKVLIKASKDGYLNMYVQHGERNNHDRYYWDPFRPLWDLHPVPRIIYSLDWLPDPRCVILSFDDGTMRTLSLLKAAYDVPVTGKPFGGTKQQGLHSYYCSSFAIWSVQVSRLTGVAHRIEKLFREFLWGGLGEETKFHLASWNKVCSPVSGGGLGVRNLRTFNKALLGKWLWRYQEEGESLWKEVVVSRHGGAWGGWCTNEVRGGYGVGLWRYIRGGWQCFENNVRFVVGQGTRIKFWQNVWCGERSLERAFPALYNIAINREASIADLCVIAQDSFQWNILFTRANHDWELSIVSEFFSMIYSSERLTTQDDRLQWRGKDSKKFSVKTYYKILVSQGNEYFPWKSIWKSRVPSKVAFFVWTAALGKILTTDNLRKRGLIVTDWCYLCKKNGESVDHLLLHCEVTRELWNGIFRRVDVAWVMPAKVVDLLACWKGLKGSTQVAAAWKMIPLCIMWCIWLERNARCFEDRERSMEELQNFFLHTLLLWFSAIVLNGNSVHEFLAQI